VVPVGIVMDMLVPHVRTAGGGALDGFPANAAQAEVLDVELEGREDDTEGVLRRRRGAYRREHAPLKERYQERGLLRIVDARRLLDKVAQDVLDALGNPEGLRYYAS
jgi:hypothetical protein